MGYTAEMSEKLLRFLLSELKTVRVLCKDAACGAITEMPIGKLDAMLRAKQCACPVCGRSFLSPPDVGQNYFAMLAIAIAGLAAIKSNVEVEFVLLDTD